MALWGKSESIMGGKIMILANWKHITQFIHEPDSSKCWSLNEIGYYRKIDYSNKSNSFKDIQLAISF